MAGWRRWWCGTATSLACAVLACACSSNDSGAAATAAGGQSGGPSGGAAGTGGSSGAAGPSGGGSGGASGSIGGSGGAAPIEAGQGGAPVDGASSACSRAKPSASNTGVQPGVTLTPSGSIRVTQNGQVVEKLDIAGEITVLANDVVVRNVRITSGDYYPIRYFDNPTTGLVVEDSEIASTSGNATSGIAFANYTARRLNIHGSADGLKADSNVLIEDCWIHDLSNGSGEHNDGVQSTGGKGVTIRHNDISGASNACVQTGDENARTEDLTIECNWLDGGGWTLNIRGAGATVPTGTRIINNRFGRNSGYGPWTIDDPAPIVTGNVYDDDGTPIPYP